MRATPRRRRGRRWIPIAVGGALAVAAAITIAVVVTRQDDAAPAQLALDCTKYDLTGCRPRCDRGDGAACEIIGTATANGLGAPLDRAGGIDLLRRACDLGDLRGCVEGMGQLRLAARAGEVPDGWQDEVVRRLDFACTRRYPQACRMLGTQMRDGTVPGGATRAHELLERACSLGDRAACVQKDLDRSADAAPAGSPP